MALKIYNSLARTKEEFVPLVPGRVHMYVCGPTVYDYPHIGHAKSYVSFDVVVRYLRFLGYRVRYVQNITDVGHLLDSGEDRILKGAQRERLEPMELVERYTRAYFDAMDALNVLRPDISPHAAGHIPEQIELIEMLLSKGFAYEVDGSVYFDISKFPEYGKLSGRKVEEQMAGARLEIIEAKRHPADFALWKKAEPEHIMQWKSPWGRGFPGWHIECSAMSMKYLGETFDIHGGGMENQFPHHECEIAQSEAATGKPFVRYWMHNNMVLVDGVKMSKSLGNFTTIAQALEKFTGEQVRFFILQSHYRSPVDFSDSAVASAAQGLEKLQNTAAMLDKALRHAPKGEASEDVIARCREMQGKFIEAMNDDFNTPSAIAVLFEFSKMINILIGSSLTEASLMTLKSEFDSLAGDVLGILPKQRQSLVAAEPFINLLVDMRARLRRERNFALADEIRQKMQELGVEIQDTPSGSEWRFLQ
ncbi:MAG: cysteine--tRNA ligase [candidate division KSB1 bacterium]|nr:cysteine--tRNA ligase [candidate division KSB1 bacterium]